MNNSNSVILEFLFCVSLGMFFLFGVIMGFKARDPPGKPPEEIVAVLEHKVLDPIVTSTVTVSWTVTNKGDHYDHHRVYVVVDGRKYYRPASGIKPGCSKDFHMSVIRGKDIRVEIHE